MAAHTESGTKVTPLETRGPPDCTCVSVIKRSCLAAPSVRQLSGGFSRADSLTVTSPSVHNGSNRISIRLSFTQWTPSSLHFPPPGTHLFFIPSHTTPHLQPLSTIRQNSDSSSILDLFYVSLSGE